MSAPNITGNTQLLTELRQMRRGAHLPHALLLHGERGCGKKQIAKWFCMLALCEHPEAAPCGSCKSCRLIADNVHPDVMTAEHAGKRMGFLIETVRRIRSEAAILPNNGDLRIFIFADADGMSIQAQNALLKSVEEPPPHALFLFTAETPGVLLPTLLSRMTAKAVFPVSQEECTAALTDAGYPQEKAAAAAARFGGNIGKCRNYLDDEAMQKAVTCADAMTAALAVQNEYELLRLLTSAAADKDLLRKTLELFDQQLRNAALCALTDRADSMLSCDAETAQALAARMTPRRILKMHGAITEACGDLESNVSAVLTASALCAALMSC